MSNEQTAARKVRTRVRPKYGKARDVMPVTGIPKGYTGRWVNDVGDRINVKCKEGWDFLTNSETVVVGDEGGVKNKKEVGDLVTKNVGGGINAYFMVIKSEWRKEDRQGYHDTVSALRASIDKEGKGKKGFYGGVNVSEGNT
jgi:hypothetical protein